MKTLDLNKASLTLYINYALIAYAFSFPISKAATNLFEIIAILLWILEGDWKTKLKLYKNNLLSISIGLLIGFSLLSILWHGNPELTFKYVSKYRHLLIIFVFYSSFNKKYTSHILSAFLLAMFISEIMSYAIFFELIKYKNISPEDPTPFMSHMTYSTILAFAINILLVRFFYEKNLKYRLFYIFFFITATTNLFINGGRTGQIIFIILILITIFMSFKHKLKAFFLSSSILLITFFLAYNLSPNFQDRSNQLYTDIYHILYEENYDGSAGTRLALTLAGISTFIDYPVQGTGVSYHMHDLNKYFKENNINKINHTNSGDYHNAFLTISVQLGIVGVFISLLIIISLLNFKFQSKEYNIISKLFAITFIIFSFTHNTFHTMNPMVFFALFAGIFNACRHASHLATPRIL
ncbi:O-antigen ligase family protein, partial [Sulfurimonas indica]|uniref:O-antigen ligase family protein n=1 Tax=Sulfurimonas indica TaxID=2508707 RepID=UPI001264E72E